jgi:predicted sugar kinase
MIYSRFLLAAAKNVMAQYTRVLSTTTPDNTSTSFRDQVKDFAAALKKYSALLATLSGASVSIFVAGGYILNSGYRHDATDKVISANKEIAEANARASKAEAILASQEHFLKIKKYAEKHGSARVNGEIES